MNELVEIVDLDLLFQSPQKDARIIGGMEEEESSSRLTMEVNIVAKSLDKLLGKQAPFIAS
jgi:hypothetical protein